MSDLGGIGNLGGIGGLGGSSSSASSGVSNDGGREAALSYRKEIRIDNITAQKIETWTGPFDTLLAKAKGYQFGEVVKDADLFTGGSDTEGVGWSYITISNVSLSRGRGNTATLIVTYSQWRQEVLVSIDHVEISRPIMTWKADDPNDAPDLVKIAKWRKLEDTAWEDYAAFKVDDEVLEGNTKKLADMIFRGIESYTLYAPVATLTLRTFAPPQLSLKPIGTVDGAVVCPYGWAAARGIDIEEIVKDCINPSSGEAWQWIVASSRVTPAADGSYTWIIQYQGIDDIDADLYSYTTGGGSQ